jgi:hypothetical protein
MSVKGYAYVGLVLLALLCTLFTVVPTVQNLKTIPKWIKHCTSTKHTLLFRNVPRTFLVEVYKTQDSNLVVFIKRVMSTNESSSKTEVILEDIENQDIQDKSRTGNPSIYRADSKLYRSFLPFETVKVYPIKQAYSGSLKVAVIFKPSNSTPEVLVNTVIKW